MAKLIIALRWMAVAALVMAVLLIIARWRYPQRRSRSQGALAYWRDLWEGWLEHRAQQREHARSIKALRNATVLVVDPDEKSSRVITWKLESLGCTVIRAKTGAQAVDSLEARTPHLIIVDALLPDIAAVDFYHSLGKYGRPVVFTGVMRDQWEDLHALGRNVACFAKPYDPDEAAALAGRMLRRATAAVEEA